MILDLKPHPAMKDSGVPWLGQVPEQWQLQRLRNVALMLVSNIDKHTKEDELSVRLCNYVDVYKNDRITDRLAFMRATASAEEIERFRLQVGDVIITKDSEMWDDIGVPALVAYEAPDLVCGYHLAILRSDSHMTGPFLFRLHQSRAVAYQYHIAANGVTRYGLSHDAIKNVSFPVPPLPEQCAIVRFLDYADRRMRRYIRAKQKLIELLNEQKQAIIHRAVTRGLDPNVRLKPSGVEWLGEVPAHWEVRRLKTLCGMRSGDGITGMSIEPAGDYPVYGGNGVRGYTSNYTHDGEFALIGRQGALCGNVHLARGRFWASEHAVVVSLRYGHALDWFGAILLVMNLNQYSIAAAQPGLAVERVLNLWLPVPPTEEQARIAKQIKHETTGIATAVDRARRGISLLREYRTRLIADVVTGKLDVREAAASLPHEADEPEALDNTDALAEGEDATVGELDAAPEEAEA
jgi:type I restriction enzyme S subunit